MNYLTHLGAAAGLFCLLAASPALADVAAAEAGGASPADATVSQAVATLQSVDALVGDLAQTVPDSSLFAATTKSTAPMSAYYTRIGSLSGLSLSQAASSNLAALAAGSPASPPAAAPSGGTAVGSGIVVSSADTGVQSFSGSPVTLTINPNLQAQAQPSVPLPSALLLLGSGLLGVIPLRRATYRAA
jgi:hypothetical protein